MREASYALDYIAQKHLNEQSWGQSKFNEVSEEVKKKNINDVNRMVKLEKLYQIIPYFEEIRVLTKALWEDLYFNSYIIEMLLFEEAKKKRVVLPNCTRNEENEESTFEGAIRECLESGALFNIGKFDLTSAYPNMVRNFCLDPRNITAKKSDKTIEVNGYNWEQNSTALLPSLIEKLLTLKDTLKKEVKKYTADTPEFKKAQIKYDAIKGVVNSAFGVMGFPSFRLYDNKVASTITFLVRDLLNYVTLQIRKEGYIVVYYDTDSVFIKTTENIAPKLNTLIRQWAKEKYGKDDISIDFEYEGYFEKIFLLTKCRYYGYLKTSKGVKTEIKGMEIKRASSSKYESEFQKNLIEKILNQDAKDNIIGWIKQEKERIKTLPLEQTAFPCKLSNREYKNIPIFVRAYNNTKALVPDFSVEKGEIFYYVFIDSPYPTRNVLAFTDKDKRVLKNERIDYTELIRRNIDMKTATIFEALGWDSNIILSTQLSLF
jgi:DNA polymerase elongation subunit (family B)